ncbi:MAG: tetratricopeptide repeat protein [Patescibacteria group bacterium]|nr:tetratricopeptide repeat protein [Patescibacteria group bacterium]
MTEAILIIFAAGLIYYVATRLAPKGLLFKLRKEEENLKKSIKERFDIEDREKEQSLVEAGQKLFNNGRFEEAEAKFIESLQLNPKEDKAYHFLGMIYLRQQEYKGAEEVLEKATELNVLNDTALNNLGLACHNQNKYEKAVAAFEKSIQLNDKIGHRYVNLGLAYQGLKDYEKAAIAFENAARIHENIDNLTLLTKNYQKLRDDKLVRKSIERLLKIDPNNTWAKRTLTGLK